jgi:hypothetical protein
MSTAAVALFDPSLAPKRQRKPTRRTILAEKARIYGMTVRELEEWVCVQDLQGYDYLGDPELLGLSGLSFAGR